ncbi:iron chelate uptake ABC transporter family permease subunit [Pseudonocardia sp. KRD-169]|uniref:Iron chelate uptake ABC transporter family permease subunit n=2 Tax=Pseudonocardia abyssalis TaxID=2792008 RepID=A0ABS6UVL4_9PSEU|nr:iron chelate uptake ABC transporter family permease subunit [Pseudonocardia abyssalis]MBW0136287.1 iron chelate uptake ABC transporter family permease subunit [Pseudonocardia abyssalis]
MALRWQARTLVVSALLAALTVVVTSCALALRDYPLSLAQVWAALTDDPAAGFARTVVFEWRAPRAIAAVVFGAGLGAAGAVFQSLTRNPLASPDIIGISAGSYTGALIVIVVVQGSYLQLTAGAFTGGIATAAVIYLLAWRQGVQGFRLIIVGIAISAMLTSFNTWLMLSAQLEVALAAAAWGAGTLGGLGWQETLVGGGVVLALLVVLATFGRALRQLELGDDAARATGTRAEPVRLAVIVIAVALTAVVASATGPIAFIALAAPQIARRLCRAPGIAVVPSALTGAVLLAAADVAALNLLPVALPVGVVTVVLGGGYLLWLLVHEVRSR